MYRSDAADAAELHRRSQLAHAGAGELHQRRTASPWPSARATRSRSPTTRAIARCATAPSRTLAARVLQLQLERAAPRDARLRRHRQHRRRVRRPAVADRPRQPRVRSRSATTRRAAAASSPVQDTHVAGVEYRRTGGVSVLRVHLDGYFEQLARDRQRTSIFHAAGADTYRTIITRHLQPRGDLPQQRRRQLARGDRDAGVPDRADDGRAHRRCARPSRSSRTASCRSSSTPCR